LVNDSVRNLLFAPCGAGQEQRKSVHRVPARDAVTEAFQVAWSEAAQRGAVMCDQLIGDKTRKEIRMLQEMHRK
jgi:hypothetical protein